MLTRLCLGLVCSVLSQVAEGMLCKRAFERLEVRGFAVCRGAVPRSLVRDVRRLSDRAAVMAFLQRMVLPSFVSGKTPVKTSENDLLYDPVSACPTAWHVDAPPNYSHLWPRNGNNNAWLPSTIMVPLTTISAAKGNAEQVLEGSHRAPMLHIRGEAKSDDVDDLVRDATRIAIGGMRYVRSPELRPGDLLLLHPRVFHRSEMFVNKRPRCLWWQPRPQSILKPSARTPKRRPMDAAEAFGDIERIIVH